MQTITGDLAVELLEAQVAKKGEDYVYRDEFESCRNFQSVEDGDAPMCIAGYVYADLGYLPATPRMVREYMVPQGYVSRNNSVSTVRNNNHVFMTARGEVALGLAQYMQDTGYSWGDALKAVKETLNGTNEETFYYTETYDDWSVPYDTRTGKRVEYSTILTQQVIAKRA